MMNRSKLIGGLAATLVYIIFGLNIVFCKDIANSGVFTPRALFTIAMAGASLLFWICSLFTGKEKISRRDAGLLALAALIGIAIPKFATLKAITMSTPYDASIVGTLKPMMALVVSCVFARKKPSFRNVLGFVLCFVGALLLVLKPEAGVSFGTSPLGMFFLLLNALSFVFYLVLFKDFVSRYSPVTFMKWALLLSCLLSLPFSAVELIHADLSMIDAKFCGEMLFYVLGATFLTNFLMPIGQKNLQPATYSLFSYVQCIVAATIGIAMGVEAVTWQKGLATLCLLAGVYFVRNPERTCISSYN